MNHFLLRVECLVEVVVELPILARRELALVATVLSELSGDQKENTHQLVQSKTIMHITGIMMLEIGFLHLVVIMQEFSEQNLSLLRI